MMAKISEDLKQLSDLLNKGEQPSDVYRIIEGLKKLEKLFEESWNLSIIPPEITAEPDRILEFHLVIENQKNDDLEIINLNVVSSFELTENSSKKIRNTIMHLEMKISEKRPAARLKNMISITNFIQNQSILMKIALEGTATF